MTPEARTAGLGMTVTLNARPMIVAWCLPPDHPPVPEPEYVFTKAAELKPTNPYHVTFKYESA